MVPYAIQPQSTKILKSQISKLPTAPKLQRSSKTLPDPRTNTRTLKRPTTPKFPNSKFPNSTNSKFRIFVLRICPLISTYFSATRWTSPAVSLSLTNCALTALRCVCGVDGRPLYVARSNDTFFSRLPPSFLSPCHRTTALDNERLRTTNCEPNQL